MKKPVLFVMIAFLIVFITGCSLQSNDAVNSVQEFQGNETATRDVDGMVLPAYFESEANNTIGTADGYFYANSKICGNTGIGSLHDDDYFKVYSSTALNFFLDANTYYVTGYAVDSSGRSLGTINYRTNTRIAYSGTFYVKISGYENVNYNLAVTTSGTSYVPDMCTIFESENNDTVASANGTFFVNQNIRGYVESINDPDYLKLDCAKQATFYLDASSPAITATIYNESFNLWTTLSYRVPYNLTNYSGIVYVNVTSATKDISYNLSITRPLSTKHVVVLVMDGARYTETWNYGTHENLPKIASEYAPNGVILTNFRNTGLIGTTALTETIPGHTALSTGVYQIINNDGYEYPANPGVSNYLRYQYNLPESNAMIMTSKNKLNVLARTTMYATPPWSNYIPYYDCADRADSLTFTNAKTNLVADQPRFMIINMKEPDSYAHAGNWTGYINAIKATDEYASQLRTAINATSGLAGTTTVFIVNDHGRHDYENDPNDFWHHGDSCDGCRHIFCAAIGPDIKTNIICSTSYELRDVTATAAYLLGLYMPKLEGKVMKDILK